MGVSSLLALLAVAMVTVSAKNCKQVETYNTGMTNSIPDVTGRRSKIVQALKNSNADFVCLQEVWMEKDIRYVTEQLASVFTHHYSPIHFEKDVLKKPKRKSFWDFFIPKKTACNFRETAILGGGIGFCGFWNGCFGKSGYALGECISKYCKSVLTRRSIRPSCVSCIFLNAFYSLNDALKQCSKPIREDNRVNSLGLLVLSKTDMQVSYTNYFPGRRLALNRGYITARLDGGFTAVCTHLSSNLKGYLEYDLEYENYQTQQIEEVEKLEAEYGDTDVVLLGDLNMGPEVTGDPDPAKNLAGEFVSNYNLMLSHGYTSPYVVEDGRCTYCNDNPLLHNYPNQVLDHVMIKGAGLSASGATRIYDDFTPPISDHYGVSLQVCSP